MADENKRLTVADNILAPLMDTTYSEIADAVIYDVVIRAQLEAYTADFELAMRKLRPYLEGHPDRTVREALELLRADLDATNHPPGRTRDHHQEDTHV